MSEFFRVTFLKGESFVSEDDSVTKCDTRLNIILKNLLKYLFVLQYKYHKPVFVREKIINNFIKG